MSAQSDFVPSDEPPSKKMRKGTHSCTECRRRKKSCIPHPNSPNVCTECFARGTQCQDQQPSSTSKRRLSGSKQGLQKRVTELEAALQTIVTKLDSTPSTNDTANGAANDAAQALTQLRSDLIPPTPSTTSVSASSPETHLEGAPVLSLFNNSILSRFQDDESTNESISPPTASENDRNPSKMDGIRRALYALFPSPGALDVILNVSQAWWAATQAMLPNIYGPESGTGVHQFITESKASGSVQKIAKALLCVCISIQEAPPGFQFDLSPSKNANDFTVRYMNVLEDLVISDDEIAGTIDGIECLFLYAKIEMNNGRIRRSWITIRRALSFAQLLGLHRFQTSSNPQLQTDNAALRGQSLWKALYQSDRFMSLLLGLPYAAPEISCPMTTNEERVIAASHQISDNRGAIFAHGEKYLLKLTSIIGHVIDRNQAPPSEDTLPLTVKIEGEMTVLADSMPSSWWAIKDIAMDDVPNQLYTRLLPQFWHHQARALLHLPFMLRAATDRRYGYNRIAALESAREMIQTYREFRPAQGFASSVCKVVDFQVFTAAMILVLNLLSTSHSSSARDQEEANKDEELIVITHDLLHRSSLETEGGVTTQAARALKMFCKTRAEPCPYGQTTARVVIPYFGTVVFGPGKSFSNPSYLPSNCQVGQLPTPETESIDSSYQSPSTNSNFLTAMPSDFNFGGYQVQQPQTMVDGEMFANVNLDLDQDWSWFWDNTSMT